MSVMAFHTCEDLPSETITRSVKQMTSTARIESPNNNIHNHECSQIFHQDLEAHESISETDIDNTAELLPSGKIQSHLKGIKTAVSETCLVLNPKVNVDLAENKLSCSPLKYSHGEHFSQAISPESTHKLVRPSLEGLLDMRKADSQDKVTIDLYSDGTYEESMETSETFQNLKRKSDDNDDEDLYTDSSLYNAKHKSRGVQKQTGVIGISLYKKVWNVDWIKLESGNHYQMGSTERNHGKTDEETVMFKNTENGQHATSSQKFQSAFTLYESDVWDDIEGKSKIQDNMTRDNNITVKDDNCYEELTQKDDLECKKINCEGEAVNNETQKEEVYSKIVNNNQKLEINAKFEESTSSIEKDSICGITSMCFLNVSRVPSAQFTFISKVSSNDSRDKAPQSVSKEPYDGENQTSTQPNLAILSSQEDKALSLKKDTAYKPQICTKKEDDSLEHGGDNNSARKKKDSIEIQNCRENLAMYLENVDATQSTPELKELITCHSDEVDGISPELTSTDFGTVNSGITVDRCSKSIKNYCAGTTQVNLTDEYHVKYEPTDRYQVPYFEVCDPRDQGSSNKKKHARGNENAIIEGGNKLLHIHDQNMDKHSPENTPNRILTTKSSKNNKDIGSGLKIMTNETQITNRYPPDLLSHQ
ncbi:uncharacterized protein [Engystomops pustulosus]|uniref:uncharacterized protein n=1 Tax=Engystomops pustulosus TaxID=76066 RepID=UPI003AFA9B1C